MKKILVGLFIAIFAMSCTEDEGNKNGAEENAENIESSLALRATLENMKDMEGLAGRSMQNQNQLCFQFVYPIVLSYNDGSTVNVTSYSQLLDLLLDETVALHIVGIQYPFDIVQNSQNQTINNEPAFQTLISNCGYDVVDVNEVISVIDGCFTVNYPFTLYVNGNAQTFNSQSDAQQYFINYSGDIQSINFDYPFTVDMVSDSSQMTINDDYELVNLIENICNIE